MKGIIKVSESEVIMSINVDKLRTGFLLEDCHVEKLSTGRRRRRESEIPL